MSIATEQVPGIYRRRVGEMVVTVLNDGGIVLPPAIFLGITPEDYESLLHAAGRRPPFASAINTFLLQWPGRTVLVDTGAGSRMGPGAGKLPAAMKAAGVAPGDIDDVVLSHLHGDHVSGLLDGAGQVAFPKAAVWVAETEMAYWEDDAKKAAAPEARRGSFDVARQTTGAYAARLHRFAYGEIMPGLEAIAMPGHTPGHTGFMVSSGDERVLILADVFHLPIVQAARPEVGTGFDSDPAQAIQTRRQVLERAVTEDLVVTGMHMSFPGFSRIVRAGDAYAVLPEVWQSDL